MRYLLHSGGHGALKIDTYTSENGNNVGKAKAILDANGPMQYPPVALWEAQVGRLLFGGDRGALKRDTFISENGSST